MSADSLTLLTIPPPLATGARSAGYHEGNCALCDHQVGRGQRIATMPDDRSAHISCIGATSNPRRTR